jgi:hypothetical protein
LCDLLWFGDEGRYGREREEGKRIIATNDEGEERRRGETANGEKIK